MITVALLLLLLLASAAARQYTLRTRSGAAALTLHLPTPHRLTLSLNAHGQRFFAPTPTASGAALYLDQRLASLTVTAGICDVPLISLFK